MANFVNQLDNSNNNMELIFFIMGLNFQDVFVPLKIKINIHLEGELFSCVHQ